MDFDSDLVHLKAQPFTIDYEHEGVASHFTPDIFALLRQPRGWVKGVLYEVKPEKELREKWKDYRLRFYVANSYSRSQGWLFGLITERRIYTPYFENARMLRSFRSYGDPNRIADKLLHYLRVLGETSPEELLEASFLTKELRSSAKPILYKMIANRVIEANLMAPLNAQSPIWLAGD